MNDELRAFPAAAIKVIDLQIGQVQFPAGGFVFDLGVKGNIGEGGERRSRIVVGQKLERMVERNWHGLDRRKTTLIHRR